MKNDMRYIHDMLCKLDSRLDDMDQKLHNLDKTTALQQVSLDEHIRRTELLESQMEPIKKHISSVQSVAFAVAKLLGIVGILVSIWAAFK